MLTFLILMFNFLYGPIFSMENKGSVLMDPSMYFASTCEIYDTKGNLVRRFYGNMCSYRNNGSLVAANKESLLFYDAQMKIISSHPTIYPHHQINLTDNGEVLIMGSEFGTIKEKRVRYDKLLIFSEDGKEIKSYSFKANYQKLIENKTIDDVIMPFVWDDNSKSLADFEILHINSFYRIPKQVQQLNSHFFKEGNYVVNSSSSRYILIFDKDLTKIIHLLPKTLSQNEHLLFHDVQPTNKGEFQIYNNYLFEDSEEKRLTKIEIYDTDFKKSRFSYNRKTPKRFYSPTCGGVQFFADGSFLYSEIIGKSGHVNFVQPDKIEIEIPIKWVNQNFGIQQIRSYKLDSFLKNNKGP